MDIETTITSRTRMIIPVHFAGQPADMNPIMDIASRNNLSVIEDAAQAHGAEYCGKRVGAIGHMGCFSFQSSKNLTAGEGGIVLTNDENFERLARSIHTCGRYPEGAWYDHFILGGNYRMTEFQAALLLNQLHRLDEQTNTREKNGQYLNLKLGEIPGIRPLIREPGEIRHSYHLFIFRYDFQIFGGAPRDHFLSALSAEGIPNMSGYAYPLHRQPMFLNREFGPYLKGMGGTTIPDYGDVSCPVSEQACYQEACWLPQSLLLGTKADMDDVVRAVSKIYEHRAELNQ
jgi:dTDP-4-amino-4,6-dideoxygalactose transaminase